MNDMAKIPGYRFVKMRHITKGLSGDRKFCVETEEGKRFLARINDCSEYLRKGAEYGLLQKVSKIGIPMPEPIGFGYCTDKSEIYTLLSWVDGEDAQKILPGLSQGEQYRLGMEAGSILRRLHNNSLTECGEDWKSRYFSVIQPRLEAYQKEGIPFEGSTQILDYLEANKHLLANRPQTLHHGDFHLGNMVIDKNGRLSVIDWDSADFENIGDPWYEFNRLGVENPAFAAGQIDGYFENHIPDTFWRLFAFYIAGSAITSIVWAKYFAPECMDEIMKLNTDIVFWYDGMKKLIPSWYTDCIGAKTMEPD